MSDKAQVLKTIVDQGMLPLFFYESPEVSLEIVKTLYRAGIRTLEYTNRGPAALANFTFLKKELAAEFPDMQLGIGTIKTPADAEAFIKAGADYIIAPIVNPAVARVTNEAGLLWVPGCMTPTEIFLAQENQAGLIKIFPANIVGPNFISSIKELFPGQLFMPTGGVEIDPENLRSWFKAGVCAVGMGSKLISKDVLANQQYDALYSETVRALELVKASK
ncbi:beta/alpha barrel domain-containing protein [Adhaeribacter rhizoryzae]|uniref:Bifunctional 4-hydroxy-2-oxoglutarate aldolase/2-dehydro-3-deoxy-phosphogluconate aldolase n=1 Tax=Adhaeribacter rhizoryzae TaxID=2607907 RepID=A0A5M6D2E3_9BACT|nr:bifunctional 4-hydroxy-2-oxoglutarate aldolase/2-dehydro-3-deoxy-phosphogluconate aldolase [Adhaeribacter rhizoryzae]KAA5541621.1 bifunctional 4-hydroxy-2-oxoglutarate aldolase/2-dehydro-3-deoxy-phosphogluconate aldolase [Adhaeribacter rhizoryzae]